MSLKGEMLKTGLLLFILSIYQYGILQTPWIKFIPALSLSLIPGDWLPRSSLILASAGDIFLDIDEVWAFTLGIFLFSCCQITLIVDSVRISGHPNVPFYPKSIMGVTLGGCVLYFVISNLAIPITFYAFLLLQLLVLALPRMSSLHGAGCLLFIGSDILVLLELILKETNQTVIPLQIIPTVGLPMYWSALLLIALGRKQLVESVGKLLG